MSCRPLLWIAAVAVSVGAAASGPSVAGAAEAAAGLVVTIDGPAAVVESKSLTITGSVSNGGAVVDGVAVSVSVVPQGLPAPCGPSGGPAVVEGDRYVVELEVDCNGPYEIQVTAQGPSGSASGAPRAVGVAEAAPQPAMPVLDVTPENGLVVSWDPGNDPDAAGSVLVVNFREDVFPVGVGEATLPPSDRRASVAVKALRWGADGPGTTTVASPPSIGNLLAERTPTNPEPNNPTEPNEPEPPPDQLVPQPSLDEPDPGPSATPPAPAPGEPSSAIPTPNRLDPTPAASSTSTQVIAAPPAPVPAEPDVKPPLAIPDDATIPKTEPDHRPSTHAEERAISTAAPVGGLVRTTDERSSGLVAPLALAVLMITIAAHIATHLRRTRSTT